MSTTWEFKSLLTALLDVTYSEPPEKDHKFYTLPNCLMTPNIAGSAGDEVKLMAEYMTDEYIRFSEGEDTKYEVTLKIMETMA